MTRRPPRSLNTRKRQAPSSSSETISAEKSAPGAAREFDGGHISACREAPVSVLDRGEGGGTVIAFPEPPARRRRRWWLTGVLGTVMVVAALLAYLVFSPALAVRTLEIQGNRLVAEEQVASALAPVMGRSLTQISDDDVKALLTGFPPVEDVSVAASPPSTLVVTVVERVPVAILQSGGKFILIDSGGRHLTSVAERGSVALPLIDGGEEAVKSEVFSSITDVLASLPSEILGRLAHASADSLDSIELKLTDGRTVFWGNGEQNAAKARVLAALLTVPGQDPPVTVYDVSTPARPVTR